MYNKFYYYQKGQKHLKLGAKNNIINKTQVQKYHKIEVFPRNIFQFGKKLKNSSRYYCNEYIRVINSLGAKKLSGEDDTSSRSILANLKQS